MRTFLTTFMLAVSITCGCGGPTTEVQVMEDFAPQYIYTRWKVTLTDEVAGETDGNRIPGHFLPGSATVSFYDRFGYYQEQYLPLLRGSGMTYATYLPSRAHDIKFHFESQEHIHFESEHTGWAPYHDYCGPITVLSDYGGDKTVLRPVETKLYKDDPPGKSDDPGLYAGIRSCVYEVKRL